MIIFHLDDFNRIVYEGISLIDSKLLKIFVNNKELSFNIENNSILIDKEYQDNDKYSIIYDNNNYKLDFRFIKHTTKFDELYTPDVNTLGSFYSKRKTLFRVFVPFCEKVKLVINENKYEMNYLGKGIFEKEVLGNLECKTYHYERIDGNEIVKFSDSFAYTNNNDNSESYILDLNKLNNLVVKTNPTSLLSTIIYEINIRDFSSSNEYQGKYSKKFLSLTEDNLRINDSPIGIDYLKDIGITHVQMMPIFSYDLDLNDYNWGYNPLSYNSLHYEYINDLSNPYNRINEFKETVNHLHLNDLKVILDVVFNHVYKAQDFNLNKQIPYISFRYKDYQLANGTYCGNEIRSEGLFMRNYIVHMCKRYIKLFDIDGLRFDLQGILDIDTCNMIAEECKKIKSSFILIGEAWDMGDVLESYKRASINNYLNMPNYHFFNPIFRDFIKENFGLIATSLDIRNMFKNIICGSKELGYRQSINYLECHDNMTYFDYLNSYWDMKDDIKKIAKLCMTLILLSRGISFIHSGQEFYRTKNGIDNTYNLGDEINKLDWLRMYENLESVDYFKRIVRLKKEISAFNDKNATIEFLDYYEVFIYKINDICLFINPCPYNHIYNDRNSEYEIIFNEFNRNKCICSSFDIAPYTIVIARKL